MEFIGRQTTKHQSMCSFLLEGSYKDGSRSLQDRDDLRQKEKQRHALKKPDHSRKLSFENNAIEKSVLVITTGPYSDLADKAAEPQKIISHKCGTFATPITHYKGFLLKM